MANTKKKKIGIVAAALAVVLAIAATAGTTLAKYVAGGEETSQATVAKWGFTVTADASNMFGTMYDSEGKVTATKDDAVVVSATSGKVIAPGTHGEFTLSINGFAETNAILTIDVTEFQDIYYSYVFRQQWNWTSESITRFDYYFPITWKVNGKTIKTRDKFYTDYADGYNAAISKNEFAEAIVDTIGSDKAESDGSKVTVKIPAETNLDNFRLTISWDWALHTDVYIDTIPTDICDEYDTVLSLAAAGLKELNGMPDVTNEPGGSFTIWEWYLGETTMKVGLKAQIEQTQGSF